MLHELGIITWQEFSISVKPPNYMAKEFFVIRESCPVQNTTKRIKQILYTKYNKIALTTKVTRSNSKFGSRSPHSKPFYFLLYASEFVTLFIYLI